MISATKFAEAGNAYLGRSYEEMDCQKFVEKCMADCGLNKDLGGSNSWYREVMKHGWVGTPEACKAEFGFIPTGALLFIHEAVSDSTPGKFRDDGIGDITHIGIRTANVGMKGKGAIHSSKSKGGVVETNFSDKSIANGGWNRVGLYDKFDYGAKINSVLTVDTTPIEDEIETGDDDAVQAVYAMVWAENGAPVKLRSRPDSRLYDEIPVGTIIEVTGTRGKWSICSYGRRKNWYMMTEFLKPLVAREEDSGEDLDAGDAPGVTVIISGLSETEADEILKKYPNAMKTYG